MITRRHQTDHLIRTAIRQQRAGRAVAGPPMLLKPVARVRSCRASPCRPGRTTPCIVSALYHSNWAKSGPYLRITKSVGEPRKGAAVGDEQQIRGRQGVLPQVELLLDGKVAVGMAVEDMGQERQGCVLVRARLSIACCETLHPDPHDRALRCLTSATRGTPANRPPPGPSGRARVAPA